MSEAEAHAADHIVAVEPISLEVGLIGKGVCALEFGTIDAPEAVTHVEGDMLCKGLSETGAKLKGKSDL